MLRLEVPNLSQRKQDGDKRTSYTHCENFVYRYIHVNRLLHLLLNRPMSTMTRSEGNLRNAQEHMTLVRRKTTKYLTYQILLSQNLHVSRNTKKNQKQRRYSRRPNQGRLIENNGDKAQKNMSKIQQQKLVNGGRKTLLPVATKTRILSGIIKERLGASPTAFVQ